MTDSSPIRFSAPFQVAWRDLDANNHMANISYFSFAAQARSLFFAEHGFGPEAFEAAGIGPATLEETMRYHREMKFLEKFTVDFLVAGINGKNSRYIITNRLRGEDGELRAELRTHFVWMDLASRRAIPAPEPLAALMDRLEKTEDFEEL
ncbi:acyl-CoA thioesterase [Emcibacter nanhaiensis]|uniref:Thioesterase n=1 Tax=Emcibacter nanhaiensis TaxID=1505037 RepID=A0A501PPV2_9PROT|nr:thioesterase family protein [Emcibacter nanhaiensis]TPD61994.1 thioesterase [Emcibacter nanhaiensis]